MSCFEMSWSAIKCAHGYNGWHHGAALNNQIMVRQIRLKRVHGIESPAGLTA